MPRSWIFYFAGIVGAALQAGGAPGVPVNHLLQSASCCGFSATVDESNLASISECAANDATCTQGISICFSDGTCRDVADGSPVSVRYWKASTVAGIPQRLDVNVANLSPHAGPTPVGWSQLSGAPLP